MASYYTKLFVGNHMDADEALPKAEAAAMKALELDERLPEAHSALAEVRLYREWDWVGAEESYKRGILLNPSDSSIRERYAFFLTARDRMEPALEQARRAVELDPLSEERASMLGWIYWNFARYDEARAALTADVKISLPGARLYSVWVESLAGNYELANRTYEDLRAEGGRFADNPLGLATYGWNLARMGRVDEALEIVGRLEESPTKAPDAYFAGIIYAGLGDHDRAFEALELAFEQRSPNLIYLAVEPFLDPIRDDSRYSDLMTSVGLAG